MRKFTVLLVKDEEDGGYTVTVPALPGCITEGDSIEDALANTRDAISLYLEDVEANGEPVPTEDAPPELRTVSVGG